MTASQALPSSSTSFSSPAGSVPLRMYQPFTARKPTWRLDARTARSKSAQHCGATEKPEQGSPDLIERMFGAVFGNKALGASEPLGMKRMSDEAYNEQSVATTTEFAAPVEGDSAEVATFRPLLAKTRLEFTPLRSAKAFLGKNNHRRLPLPVACIHCMNLAYDFKRHARALDSKIVSELKGHKGLVFSWKARLFYCKLFMTSK